MTAASLFGQNVVLELGMLLASPNLGRSRVVIFLKDQYAMERPSDIQGLIYIPFHDRVTEAGTLLAKELTEQGIPIAVKDL
ncbi:MAG: nucleotide-binding protein [Acidobacteria bacterium]|nr:nucleotide-binding protein [Acidobacteriota bacterium]